MVACVVDSCSTLVANCALLVGAIVSSLFGSDGIGVGGWLGGMFSRLSLLILGDGFICLGSVRFICVLAPGEISWGVSCWSFVGTM